MEAYAATKGWALFPKFYIFLTIHILAVVGIFLFPPTWTLVVLVIALNFLVGCLGITLTYHRCLAHKAFKFKNKNVERIFVTFASLAMEQGPIWWSSIHRLHHRYSDTPQDPHDSLSGFWYAHFLWLFKLDPRWKKPYQIECYESKAKDLASDPYYRWLDRHFYVPPLVSFTLLFLIGGWPWLFWGGFLRTVVTWHSTWFVNSVTHKFGYRSFSAGPEDTSTNNWWVGILAHGEGWHNNHHAFPSSPRQGFFRWWEFDLTYLIIKGMEKVGLVHELHDVTERQLEMARLSHAA